MTGMQGCAGVGAGQGGIRAATAEPPRRYDPSMYAHLESWETPLPPVDEEPKTEELPTLPPASGSTQLLSQTVRAGGSGCNEGGEYTSLLQQGLGDDDDGGLDLRFDLCSGGSKEASRTLIIDTDPSPRGVGQGGSQRTDQTTLRDRASIAASVGPSAVVRLQGSTALSADRSTSNWPACNGAAAGSPRVECARPSMSERTTPTQSDVRDAGACRPLVRPVPTVENITRGVSNMRAHSDGGDDDGVGGDDADERLTEDVDAGDDDKDIPVRPLGKTDGRGRARSRGPVRSQSVGRGGRGCVSDDAGKSVRYWSPEEQLQLVRCKREQEMHLAGLGHNYGRMRTRTGSGTALQRNPNGVQLPRRGGGGGESVGSEAGGEGFPEERSSARESENNTGSGAGGGKRKNARKQALELIANVMDRHGELMSSTIESSSKRQCSIFTRQCDILEQEVAVQKEHYAASNETQRMMCHALLEIHADSQDRRPVAAATSDLPCVGSREHRSPRIARLGFKSGNRRRGYNLAFQYALESVATDIARAMWYGEEWCNVVSPAVCAHTTDLSLDLPLWFADVKVENRPNDDDMAAYQESTIICVTHAFWTAVQMRAVIDGEFISHDRLWRVADCFRLLLAACIWIMRMSGDDPRSHFKAFHFATLVSKPTLVASMHR
ncbi:hypothetical protein CBR_g457 [Chara braunii]|uniref:Uncharacterized protein n=1 Tax=Chara braunii TaxID=69332 RepID=A0A388KB82_CHABU|nr:hypothetical protein CBR_g457 [Chara braunii]|eukprot:GBG67318.1 hypothetical protein CBR_g457 [Chara braunii]